MSIGFSGLNSNQPGTFVSVQPSAELLRTFFFRAGQQVTGTGLSSK